MKLTLGKIYGSVNALKILNEARLPIKVTYKLSKNIKEIENNLSTINPQIKDNIRELTNINKKIFNLLSP